MNSYGVVQKKLGVIPLNHPNFFDWDFPNDINHPIFWGSPIFFLWKPPHETAGVFGYREEPQEGSNSLETELLQPLGLQGYNGLTAKPLRTDDHDKWPVPTGT